MKLMGIKNCHCCTKRSGCTKKSGRSNLTKTPIVTKKGVRTKEWSRGSGMLMTVATVTVTSFCRDFKLERGKAVD
jgi:hypothetical protein